MNTEIKTDTRGLAAQQAPHRAVDSTPDFAPGIAAKRFLDLVLAASLFVVTLPVVLFVMILVKLTSRGPVIYSQVRLGLDGVEFEIHKIRTMWADAEKHSGPRWSTPGDDRITPVGRFLRKSHLDELPQLWNVLRGEMSLVGPRPERPMIAEKLERALPDYRRRLAVPPGVTGLAQVQLPPDTDLESVRVKLMCDLYYVERPSLWLDFRLILCTGLALFGLNYRRSCKLLRIPGREAIEGACPVRAVEPESLSKPQIQPAY